MRRRPVGHPFQPSVAREIVSGLGMQVDRFHAFLREEILRRENGVIHIPVGITRPAPEAQAMNRDGEKKRCDRGFQVGRSFFFLAQRA